MRTLRILELNSDLCLTKIHQQSNSQMCRSELTHLDHFSSPSLFLPLFTVALVIVMMELETSVFLTAVVIVHMTIKS